MSTAAAAAALPALQLLQAPPQWDCIEFISDLHLAQEHPRTFEAWAGYLRDTHADAVFLLGDIFEAWVGDDARHEGFELRCAQVLQEAARRRSVFFMAGNRDFLVGRTLLEDCGARLLNDPALLEAFGHRFLLTHGDLLCTGDADYLRFRAQVRQPAWQAAFLARPLAERRALARAMRDASRQHQAAMASWADVDRPLAIEWLRSAGCGSLIHGHTHRPGSEELAGGLVRHVLTDWDLDDPDQPRAEVLRLTAAGVSRYPIAAD